MFNKVFPLGATLALLMGLMIGCTDSTVDSNSTTTDDAYEKYSPDVAALSDFSEIPTVDEVFAQNAPAADITVEKNRREHVWGRLELGSYKHILQQLGLSDEQKAAIKRCFDAYRDCVKSAAERYRTVRQEKHDALKDRIARVRAAVENGSMTAEEGRNLVKGFTEAYRNDIIEMNAAFKAAIEDCRTRLHDCIRGHLTAEQIAKWDELNG